MTTRTTAFSRAIEYFRNADLTEAQACLNAAQDILKERRKPLTPVRHRRHKPSDTGAVPREAQQ
jgi:hypothetical protein